jgi:hypothetical protein
MGRSLHERAQRGQRGDRLTAPLRLAGQAPHPPLQLLGRRHRRIDEQRLLQVPAGRLDVFARGAQQGQGHQRARPRPAAGEAVLEGGALAVRQRVAIMAGGHLHAIARPRQGRLQLGLTRLGSAGGGELADRAVHVTFAERVLATEERLRRRGRGLGLDGPHRAQVALLPQPIVIAAATSSNVARAFSTSSHIGCTDVASSPRSKCATAAGA